MATFKVPCNWDFHLLDAIDPAQNLILFGTLPSSLVGSGRPSAAIKRIYPDEAYTYIKTALAKGFRFNYLFNAPCLDAREYTDSWRKQFLAELDRIFSLGIRDVTVSIPYLIEVIKQHFPEITVSVSSYARINSIQRARYFEDLGADDLILDPVSMTRNFPVLRLMTKLLHCKLTLIANGFCLYQCPYAEYHGILMGHSSQLDHPSNGYYAEYPFYNCTLKKLTNPVEIIKAAFIRPEDINVYESIGITQFKLVDRTRPTNWILTALDSYLQGSFVGDLLQIINFPHSYLNYLVHISGNDSLLTFPILENDQLDGLIDQIQNINCSVTDCKDCGICQEYARKAVWIPSETALLLQILKNKCIMLNFG